MGFCLICWDICFALYSFPQNSKTITFIWKGISVENYYRTLLKLIYLLLIIFHKYSLVSPSVFYFFWSTFEVSEKQSWWASCMQVFWSLLPYFHPTVGYLFLDMSWGNLDTEMQSNHSYLESLIKTYSDSVGSRNILIHQGVISLPF